MELCEATNFDEKMNSSLSKGKVLGKRRIELTHWRTMRASWQNGTATNWDSDCRIAGAQSFRKTKRIWGTGDSPLREMRRLG
jgi:hypothetical protein